MIVLHNQKGGISGQIQKDFLREDVVLLGSNILKTEGAEWQCVLKCRKTNPSFPAQYQFILSINDAFQKEHFFIELNESEARQKLKSWGFAPAEIDKLILMEVN